MSEASRRPRPNRICSDDADEVGHPVKRFDKGDVVQMLRETEDIAFRVRQWIEPTPPPMNDDDDFRAAPVF